MITFEEIKKNEEINTYIKKADESLKQIGYTEHSFAHVTNCVNVTTYILKKLNYSDREIELGKIASYMHDIGNVINRNDHATTGALMAMQILKDIGLPYEEIALIITAIGNHDEESAYPVNSITAALILADKTDVRRSRVRDAEDVTIDIHDRVNYAVTSSKVEINDDNTTITLFLKIDTTICPVMEYFEIFLKRMLLCQKAANELNLKFKLVINELAIL